MRVLHCLWTGEIGGMERAVYQLVRSQVGDPDLEPALLFAQGRGRYYERARQLGCPVLDLAVPHGHAVTRLRSVARAMRPYDVHHFHAVEPTLMLASLWSGRAYRIYTHRGGPLPPGSYKRRAQYGLGGLLMRNWFHGFSANTRHAADCAAPVFRLNPAALRVTYNGIDFGLLEPERGAGEMRAELGLAESDFIIGTAANLRDWKRIDRLIVAISRLAEPIVQLVVVGDGPDRARLQALAHDLGAAERIHFVGWYGHIGDLLQLFDVFVLPSSARESFGNAAVEAMAMGVPTIVFSDGGGLVEHVDDGETGFVVEDQAALERRLGMLLRDAEARDRIGSRARRVIRDRYALDRSASAYRELYESVLSSDR